MRVVFNLNDEQHARAFKEVMSLPVAWRTPMCNTHSKEWFGNIARGWEDKTLPPQQHRCELVGQHLIWEGPRGVLKDGPTNCLQKIRSIIGEDAEIVEYETEDPVCRWDETVADTLPRRSDAEIVKIIMDSKARIKAAIGDQYDDHNAMRERRWGLWSAIIDEVKARHPRLLDDINTKTPQWLEQSYGADTLRLARLVSK